MPVFEFRCKKCQAITEILCWGAGLAQHGVTCGQCGSKATVKVISRVSFKVAKPAKYGEEFLHKARPFLRRQKETAEYFAEGKKQCGTDLRSSIRTRTIMSRWICGTAT